MKHKQYFECPNCKGKIPASSLGSAKCKKCGVVFQQPCFVHDIYSNIYNEHEKDWSNAWRLFELHKLTDAQLQIISCNYHNKVQQLINSQYTKEMSDNSVFNKLKRKYNL